MTKKILASQRADKPQAVVARKILIGIPALLALVFLLFADSYWSDRTLVYRSIRWSGIVLMGLCIIGRTWTSLYIGGRKNLEVIDIGPYSMSRNPLYFFSIIGAIGASIQFESLVVGLLAGVLTWLVFFWLTLGEEAYLLAKHGDTYRSYMTHVPRFAPKLNYFNSPDTLVVRPRAVSSTFFDSLFFLISIPLADSLAYLHSAGILPVYFIVP
jgi:protein-S-isoprenylcysteine O-methyltransferase Ste14